MEENNLPELPKGWVLAKVGDILEPSDEKVDPTKTQIMPYIGLEHIEKDKGRLLGHGNSNEVRSTKASFYAGDLLYGKLRPYLNKVCVADFDGVCSTDILVFPKQHNVSNKFLCYRFLCSDLVQYASQHMSGVQHPRLSFVHLSQFPLSLPPLPEQRRIVAKIEELFTKLDAGVEALNKIKTQLKRYRQAVLRDAFQGKLTQEWREAHKGELEPASTLLERIKEERRENARGKYEELPPLDTSDLPELPKGWAWTRLGDITLIVTKGSTPTSYGFTYTGRGINFIKVENTRNGKVDRASISEFINEDAHEFLRRSQLAENDVLFSIAGTIGRVAIVQHEDLPANTNQAIALIRCPWQFISPKYLKNILESTIARSSIEKRPRGIGMNNVSLGDVNNIVFPLPSLHEQHKIVAEIERRLSVAEEIEKTVDQSLKQAGRLRQSILKRAFEGSLVPQDPNDEPAEKLLQRIEEERTKQQPEGRSAKRGKRKTAGQNRLPL